MGIKFVTTTEIANECGVTRTTVLRWIEKGYIKGTKLPSGWNRILREELERFKNQWGFK